MIFYDSIFRASLPCLANALDWERSAQANTFIQISRRCVFKSLLVQKRALTFISSQRWQSQIFYLTDFPRNSTLQLFVARFFRKKKTASSAAFKLIVRPHTQRRFEYWTRLHPFRVSAYFEQHNHSFFLQYKYINIWSSLRSTWNIFLSSILVFVSIWFMNLSSFTVQFIIFLGLHRFSHTHAVCVCV